MGILSQLKIEVIFKRRFRMDHRTKPSSQTETTPKTVIWKPSNKRTGKLHQANVNKKQVGAVSLIEDKTELETLSTE